MSVVMFVVFFFKQKTAYEMRISDWSSDVCSSDLAPCTSGKIASSRHWRPQHDRDAGRVSRPGARLAGKSCRRIWDRGTPRSDGRTGSGARPPLAAAEGRQWLCRHQLAKGIRSEEHTSELQSLMRNSYAVFCLH